MILVDTSVWIDHLRAGDKTLASLLGAGGVLIHPFVIGEIALGNLKGRVLILKTLQDLPQVSTATDQEVLHFIERNGLFGLGIGYIDAHLLASVRLMPGARFWTRDRRLHDVASRLSLTADLPL